MLSLSWKSRTTKRKIPLGLLLAAIAKLQIDNKQTNFQLFQLGFDRSTYSFTILEG